MIKPALNPSRQKKRRSKGRTVRNSNRIQGVTRSYYWWPITNAKIQQAAQKIADSIHPERIILFGSFAYGKPQPDSDVDLLVIMESDESTHTRSAQISEILYPRPFPVDIIVRTPAEVSQRLAIGDFFLHEIVTKGRVLYERASRR
ncbi:MAG: nucleotidyltransferase domain-containing protein [bacterium]